MDFQLQHIYLPYEPVRCSEPLLLLQTQIHAVPEQLHLHRLTDTHHVFYLADAAITTSLARKKAAKDIAAIRLAFPRVYDDKIVLAMATWFALLCTVDDAVEKLAVSAAELAIAQSIATLEKSMRPGKPRKPSFYDPSCFADDIQRVSAVIKAFVSQMRGLLPERAYIAFIAAIINVLQGISAERVYRELGDIDEQTYINIRLRTVGLQPFFVLLSHTFRVASCEASAGSLLMVLESSLALAVGLQNDILGLSKDLQLGEICNFVILDSQRSGHGFDSSLGKAVRMHNAAVEEAVDSWAKLTEHCGSSCGLSSYADSILGFAATHFVWASSAERYAV
ncbi:hypothetical protein LTR36_000417 [Oleoguttula mirabilis]|uniref:Terpenoid synthase n=1 Tax=Oleoguttula mirabilis TaxID=1507867 RepID=A0AAV9K0I7_9PEZI|nr:hypothetical protein LTR36_000417 [Oleoguttula mirabilis]